MASHARRRGPLRARALRLPGRGGRSGGGRRLTASLHPDADTLLGFVYLSGYLTAGLLGIARELREREMPAWLFALGSLSFAAEAVGMFLYLAEMTGPWPRRGWSAVFAGILVSNALEMRFAYRSMVREPDPALPHDEVRAASLFATGATLLVELPSLWMNFRLAFA